MTHAMCSTCAFRSGTEAATSPSTQLTARLCIMSGDEFSCHEVDQACAGWQAAVAKAKPVPDWQRKLASGLLEIHRDNMQGMVCSEREGLDRIWKLVAAIDEGDMRDGPGERV